MKLGKSSHSLVIGVDFDNTLLSYDDLIHLVAVNRGLIPPQAARNKMVVRDSIRKLPGGEIEWQKVQGLVYGPRIQEATPAPGAAAFLRRCAFDGVKVNIVSHKTELANYDETGTNLRSAALSWMERHQFFDSLSFGLSPDDVYFESTRREKLERIAHQGCTHFIDDLEETFLEEAFPAQVKKIFYSPQGREPVCAGIDLAGNWDRITDYFFHANM